MYENDGYIVIDDLLNVNLDMKGKVAIGLLRPCSKSAFTPTSERYCDS